VGLAEQKASGKELVLQGVMDFKVNANELIENVGGGNLGFWGGEGSQRLSLIASREVIDDCRF
jgi:hypothetical protein